MTKQILKTKLWSCQGHLSAKNRRKERAQKLREKQRRNQRKTKDQGQEQGVCLSILSSSQIQGKTMNLECFSIMFEASYACYDKL